MKKFQFCSLLLFMTVSFTLQAQNHYVQRAGSPAADQANDITGDALGNVYVTGTSDDDAQFGSILVNQTGTSGQFMFVAQYNQDGVAEWAKLFGTMVTESHGIAKSNQGNIYVTGTFQDSIHFDQVLLQGSSFKDVFVACLDSAGNTLWANKAISNAALESFDVAVDNAGNCYITGSFVDSVNFEGTEYYSAGLEDIFIAKYSATGLLQWVETAGGAQNDRAKSILTDAAGNIYVTGQFQDTATFSTFQEVAYGADDIFLASYDSSGIIRWLKKAGDIATESGEALALDPAGNIQVAGIFYTFSTMTFDAITFSGAGATDFFIATYDTNGNVLDVMHDGGSFDEMATGLAIDNLGNRYLTGNFSNTGVFGGASHTSNGSTDVMVLKYNNAGILTNVKTYGGLGPDAGNAITISNTDQAISAGYFNLNADFGNTSLTSSDTDIFLATMYDDVIPPAGLSVFPFHTGNSGLHSNNITDITLDQFNRPWITTADSGISYYDFVSGTWESYSTVNSGIPSNKINSIYIDSANVKWLCTADSGLVSFDGVVWRSYTTDNSNIRTNSINAATGFPGNPSIWTGTNDSGCVRLNLLSGVGTPFNTLNSNMPADRISAMAADSSSNFWIGTDMAGAAKFTAGVITVYNMANSDLPGNSIRNIWVDDPNGLIWFATDGGLASYDGATWNVFNVGTGEDTDDFSDYATSVLNGFQIKGTKKKGTVINDGIVLRRANTSNSTFDNNAVAIAIDPSGSRTWIANQFNGVTLLVDSNFITGIQSGNKVNDVLCVYPNPANGFTHIKLTLPSTGNVTVQISDISGRRCKTLNFNHQTSGVFKEKISTSDLSSGLYILSVESPGIKTSKRLSIINEN